MAFFEAIRRRPAPQAGTSARVEWGDLRRLVGENAKVILDVGCNDGADTLRFLDLFPEAAVHAFEPDSRAQQRFRARVASSRAHLHAVAIGDRDGAADFHVSSGTPPPEWGDCPPGGWDESGSLRQPKEHLAAYPWCRFDTTVAVEVMTLDTWVRAEGIGLIDLIWADIQGAEVDLVRGGRHALSQTRFLYTEYCNRELYEGQIDLDRLLRILTDFDLVQLYKTDVLLKNRCLS